MNFTGFGWGKNVHQNLGLLISDFEEKEKEQNKKEKDLFEEEEERKKKKPSGDSIKIQTPTLIPILESNNIIHISSGSEKTCFVNSSNIMYEYGKGISKFTKHTTLSRASRITKIAAGRNHFLILTSNGVVYALGSNFNGEIGYGEDNMYTIDSPSQVPFFQQNEIKCKDIACGHEQGYFLTVEGLLYSCGANLYGELGVGNNTIQISPTLVRKDVAKIYSGTRSHHFFFLDNKNKLFSCGLGKSGQLGLGSKKSYNKPKELKKLRKKKFSNICCGQRHSLMLMESKVYSCGDIGVNGTMEKKLRTKFAIIPKLADETVLQIAAGAQHSIVLTAENEIFVFGSNSNGQLGLQGNSQMVKIDNQLIPTKINKEDFSNIMSATSNSSTSIKLVCGSETSFIFNLDFGTLEKDFHSMLTSNKLMDLKLKNKFKINKLLLKLRLKKKDIDQNFLEKFENLQDDQIKLIIDWIYTGRNKEQSLNEKIINLFELENIQSLKQDLLSLYQMNDQKKDFTLQLDNQELKIHSLILVARSEKFAEKFDLDNSLNNYQIKKQLCSFETLKIFVKFLYTDYFDKNIQINEKTKQELCVLKEKWKLSKYSDLEGKIIHSRNN
ncbi:regulator of chromosome condensation [Anaeramoeba flamelloides]|uniref:Regulator of chromosome condensation n=1 Tax=Anaeramoeba flamelloides TaxID=1746091 RepID=A0ABQ8YQS5_9EUKA|nr:regulator of chromosome condensation [Anaeramoeba flamelloides]